MLEKRLETTFGKQLIGYERTLTTIWEHSRNTNIHFELSYPHSFSQSQPERKASQRPFPTQQINSGRSDPADKASRLISRPITNANLDIGLIIGRDKVP